MMLRMAMTMTALVALLAPTAAGALCDYGELTVDLGDIVEPAFKCQSLTEYSFVPPSTLPTADQIKAICTKCKDLVSAAARAKLPSCALALDNGSTVALDKFFGSIVAQCDKNDGNATKNKKPVVVKGSADGDSGSTGSLTKPPTAGSTTAPPVTTRPPSASASSTSGDDVENEIVESASGSASDEDDGGDQDSMTSASGSTGGSIEEPPSMEPEVTTMPSPSPTSSSVPTHQAAAARSLVALSLAFAIW